VTSRGPLALQMAKIGRQMGVEIVVPIHEGDADARWPDSADYAAYIPRGEGRWPGLERVIEVAADAGCDAIHPGWSWLARSPELAGELSRTGMGLVGPRMDQLAAMNDRGSIRDYAEEIGIPVVPGSEALIDEGEAQTWLAWTGLPAVIKPVTRGAMDNVVLSDLAQAPSQILAAMNQGPVLLERLVKSAREIEVPFMGDGEGGVVTLGDRETTFQLGGRRVIVECPAPGLDDVTHEEVATYAHLIASGLEWDGLGAARFLVTPDGRAYFLTLRAGLQPWYPVTEAVVGVDLIEAQIRVAGGEHLGWSSDDVDVDGHALVVCIIAREAGTIEGLALPEGLRIDLGVEIGDQVQPGDEIATLQVHTRSRQTSIVQAKAALDVLKIKGCEHNGAELSLALADAQFWSGTLTRDHMEEIQQRIRVALESGSV
jgi:3-methylcrotonyl-CoA carboxylase alpha subunit